MMKSESALRGIRPSIALTDKMEDWERYLNDTYTEFNGSELEAQQ